MLIILPISFSHLSESYFLCHIIHMSFLKAMFKWCQAQNTLKALCDPTLSKYLFFCRNVGRKQKEDITIIFLPVIQKQIQICTITLLGRHACMGRSFMKKCELTDWIIHPTCTASDENLNVHLHIHCVILRRLQRSIPHLLVGVQWMHTIHNILNIIRITLSNDVPLM